MGWQEAWIDFGPSVKRSKPSISSMFKGRRARHLPRSTPF